MRAAVNWLVAALIGLQRAADRRGNRVRVSGPGTARGLEGLFGPASAGNVEIEVARLKYN